MFWIFKKQKQNVPDVLEKEKQDLFNRITGCNIAGKISDFADEHSQWLQYYLHCSVLNDAINRILDLFDPIVFKNFPNIDRLQIASYIIYGNLYLGYTKLGSAVFIHPESVSIENQDKMMEASYVIDGKARFDYLGNPFNSRDMFVKLIHVKNQNLASNKIIGESFILPIKKEVNILIEGCKYSLALLQNGARFDGFLTSKEPLNETALQSILSQFQSQHRGAKNAGKTLLINGDLAYQAITGQTNRDMDYKMLIDLATTTIYNHFKIPLPMVSLGASTYNNFAEANSKIYSNAILPIAQNIIFQLNHILGFQTNSAKAITIDINNLPLQGKFVMYELINMMKNSAIFTVNEMRTQLGMNPLEGGDIIWNSSGTQPLAYMGSIDESLYKQN